jgi:hypothetical protein
MQVEEEGEGDNGVRNRSMETVGGGYKENR